MTWDSIYSCGDPAICGWPVDPCYYCPVELARRQRERADVRMNAPSSIQLPRPEPHEPDSHAHGCGAVPRDAGVLIQLDNREVWLSSTDAAHLAAHIADAADRAHKEKTVDDERPCVAGCGQPADPGDTYCPDCRTGEDRDAAIDAMDGSDSLRT